MESNIAGLYDLDKVLGKGHYGIVRLARHAFSGQEVAVKVIDKTKLDQRETEHLLKEVQCMKLVRHPNVVRLYQVITTNTKLYLILELGNGGDLLDYLNIMPHGLGEERSRDYFSQIIRAIAYCHHLHIVHRDLKPENIIFNEDYSILKLTDFGFSNEFCPGEKLMTYCGSWKYSAPEILLQEEYDPPAVDVWSLGVMLFQMVAGRLPFSEVNESETLTKIMDGKYEMPDEISDDLSDLLARMIVVEPKDRITVDEIIDHPWCYEVKKGGPINGLVHEVGISAEEHEKVVETIVKNEIATRDAVKRSLEANSYDYVSATYLLLAEQLKQKRINRKVQDTVLQEQELLSGEKTERTRRGSMPEVNSELLRDIRNRVKIDPPSPSPTTGTLKSTSSSTTGTLKSASSSSTSISSRRGAAAVSSKKSSVRSSGSSCSGSEDDPSKSPTLGGEKFLRDEDTFFTGKLKASPKRFQRRPIGSLNIHAVNSSSEESEEEDLPLIEQIPRSKTLTRIFRRPTPPSTSLMNIDEGAEEDENLTGTKSVPGTIRKKKALQGTNSLETARVYAEEAVDVISPLSTPSLSVQRKQDPPATSTHSSFSSSVELSSDDSEMDLAKRKKTVALTKRDRTQKRNSMTNANMLSLMQEKLRQMEVDQNVRFIRYPLRWSIVPTLREEEEGEGTVVNLQRAMSDDGLPVEMFGTVRSSVCSVM